MLFPPRRAFRCPPGSYKYAVWFEPRLHGISCSLLRVRGLGHAKTGRGKQHQCFEKKAHAHANSHSHGCRPLPALGMCHSFNRRGEVPAPQSSPPMLQPRPPISDWPSVSPSGRSANRQPYRAGARLSLLPTHASSHHAALALRRGDQPPTRGDQPPTPGGGRAEPTPHHSPPHAASSQHAALARQWACANR